MILPTVNELSQGGAQRTTLLLLRCLCSSDLAFHYMLYNKSTIRDICDEACKMIEMREKDDDGALNDDEYAEACKLIEQLEQYARVEPPISWW